MSDSFWIWVAIAVISFLSRVLKKKTPEPAETSPEEAPDTNKPMTFEELLREIQATKAPAPPPPAPAPVKSVPAWKEETVDYDDNLEPEEKDLETIGSSYKKDDAIYDVYERAKRDAFSRPSLEETAKLEDTVVRFAAFKGYQRNEQKSVVSQYKKDFQDPEGFKKAFIMSEILKRRF